MKKKKKKKTTFDLDAALADGDSQEASTPTAASLEVDLPENSAADGIDLENDLDLENFGKKKRKKKKTGFNLDDLDAALPTTEDGNQDPEETGAAVDEGGNMDDNFDLGTKKKKKKNKIEINELLKDNKENEEVENGKKRSDAKCLIDELHLAS